MAKKKITPSVRKDSLAYQYLEILRDGKWHLNDEFPIPNYAIGSIYAGAERSSFLYSLARRGLITKVSKHPYTWREAKSKITSEGLRALREAS